MRLTPFQISTGWNYRLAVCLLLSFGIASAQTIAHSFDGDQGPGLAVCESGVTHCHIPEMNLGVNGKQAVQITWQNVSVYDYSGKLLRATPLKKLFRDAGLNPVPSERAGRTRSPNAGPFEPTVVYNEFIGRWMITATGEQEALLVSATDDALGAWGGIYPSCLNDGPCLTFDPAAHLGFDKNGVYTCGGHLDDDNPNTIPKIAYDCFAIPMAEVAAIAQGKKPAHIHRAHNMPHEIFPAVDHTKSKSPSAPAFFMAKTCDREVRGACQNAMNNPFRWVVDSFTWNGTGGQFNVGGEQLVKTSVGSTEDKWLYSKPCCGPLGSIPQAGNDKIVLRVAESHRLSNLVQRGTHLYGAMPSGPCTANCGTQGTDSTNVLFWVDIDCTNPAKCVVSQTGKISAPGVNPAFGTVGVDAAGNIGIVAMSSSATTNLSILLWTRKATDPPNTFSGPATVIAGTQPYTCLNTQDMATIGNAVGVQTALDPLDGSKLWTTQQWANNAERCVWNTRIVGYQIAPSKGSAKPPKK